MSMRTEERASALRDWLALVVAHPDRFAAGFRRWLFVNGLREEYRLATSAGGQLRALALTWQAAG